MLIKNILGPMFAILASCGSAFAGEVFDCNATTMFVSRALFANAGAYTTKGSANFLIADCEHKATGVYLNVFGITPMYQWRNGREVDVRVGWRYRNDGLATDVSVAMYHFGIGPGPDDMRTALNVRGKATYTFVVMSNLSVTPYVGVDLQQVYPTNRTDHAVFGGVATKFDLARLHLSVDAALWHHVKPPYDKYRRTIGSVTTTLMFDVNEQVSVGPRYVFSSGGATAPHRGKHAWGLVLTGRF